MAVGVTVVADTVVHVTWFDSARERVGAVRSSLHRRSHRIHDRNAVLCAADLETQGKGHRVALRKQGQDGRRTASRECVRQDRLALGAVHGDGGVGVHGRVVSTTEQTRDIEVALVRLDRASRRARDHGGEARRLEGHRTFDRLSLARVRVVSYVSECVGARSALCDRVGELRVSLDSDRDSGARARIRRRAGDSGHFVYAGDVKIGRADHDPDVGGADQCHLERVVGLGVAHVDGLESR